MAANNSTPLSDVGSVMISFMGWSVKSQSYFATVGRSVSELLCNCRSVSQNQSYFATVSRSVSYFATVGRSVRIRVTLQLTVCRSVGRSVSQSVSQPWH
jgi:hypothetical protein